MDTQDHPDHQAHIENLLKIGPVLAKAAAGDFSQNIPIPEKEDEFTTIYVGIQLLLDVIREKMARMEKINLELEQRVEEKTAMLQSIGDGVVVLDKDGLVTFMNPAACRMSGWNQEEVLGHKWVQTVALERSDKSVVPIEERPLSVDLQIRSENVIDTTTYYYVRKDKSRFPVRTNITPVQVNNQPVGMIIVFHDVTKEKEIAELKEDFLSLATHQLRSPLATMLWTLDTVLKNATELTPEDRQKLQTINRTTQNMIELVNDILSVTRVNQDILEEQKSPFNVVSFLKTMLEQSQDEAATHQVKLDLQVSEPRLYQTEYSMDTGLFRQCVQNLVANAIRYSKPGGTVEIKVSLQAEKLCIEVQDHGIGIPEKDQAHIFEKFYRGGNVPIDAIPGSGLGLFIVKSLVERWGGTLTFTSAENQGTTFTICLPLQPWPTQAS